MTKKVFLWTAPRSISTAFERSMMEIKHSKIFHEPYGPAYFLGPERQSTRYIDVDVDEDASYHSVTKLLSKHYDGVEFHFSKDMALYVENHFEMFLEKELLEFQHTFLVRHPGKSIPSLYKASTNIQFTGWDYFDPIDCGFSQMQDLFCFVKNNLHQNPVVVNADDLQAHPNDTMKAYCEAVGFPFDESMLKWEPGRFPEGTCLALWNGWHANFMKSTGFVQRDMKSLQVFEDLEYLPDEVLSTIKDKLPFYNFLLDFKLKF